MPTVYAPKPVGTAKKAAKKAPETTVPEQETEADIDSNYGFPVDNRRWNEGEEVGKTVRGAIKDTLGTFQKQLFDRDHDARQNANEMAQLRQMIAAMGRKVDKLMREDEKNKAELAQWKSRSGDYKEDMIAIDEKMHRFRTELIKKWESEEAVRRREDDAVKDASVQHAKEALP